MQKALFDPQRSRSIASVKFFAHPLPELKMHNMEHPWAPALKLLQFFLIKS